MYVCWVIWPQDALWNKEYPIEMEYLFDIALPSRQTTGQPVWNYFATPNAVQINIYDPETIVAFKLKFGDA